jgi:hypothetical protein
MSEKINVTEEFVELSDLTSDELVEVVIPRSDLSADAHRRRRALEILMTRCRGVRHFGRPSHEVKAILEGSIYEGGGVSVKENTGVDNNRHRKNDDRKL